MGQQFVDLGLSAQQLTDYLTHECRLWDTEEKRTRYGYVLSPCAYIVSKQQQQELQRLARDTYRATQDIAIQLHTLGNQTSRNNDEDQLVSIATRSSKGLLRPGEAHSIDIPPIMKIDLVQTLDDSYKIVEIDAYNPRGLGFITLLENSIRDYNTKRYPGIATCAKRMKTINTHWTHIYSDFERYYAPVFDIWIQEMKKHGVYIDDRCTEAKPELLTRTDLQFDRTTSASRNISIIPESLFNNKDFREHLLTLYRSKSARFFYHPTAYLGSKALLPYIREKQGMKNWIPETSLLFKKSKVICDSNKEYVLKAGMSSGMKGVYFSDTDSEFEPKLAEVSRNKRPSWIVQEQVAQQPYPITVFNKYGERITANYYLRVIAHITKGGILDVEITGRPDKKVHGAPDCIQLPTILD